VDASERFVPQRVVQLMRELAGLPWRGESDAESFRSLARLLSALYHFEFHEREQSVIEAWERAADDAAAGGTVRRELIRLLQRANYVEVTMDELHDAMARESLTPLRLQVDLDDYGELVIYRRGSRRQTVDIPRWKGLRTEKRTITVEDRVVVLARVKSKTWFDGRGIDPAERNLVPGHLSLKQFQDVPRADIEMLLPSTQVRLRPIDSLLVGLPAVASGIIVLATKLLPTLGLMFVLIGAWLGVRDEQPELDQGALVALFGGLIALGGFLVRQWTKLKNRRLMYLKTLSETLYFRTLADGPGVLHTLLSSAEQQEVIEVILAYRFLLDAPGGLTRDDLDRDVERWLRSVCHRDIDFEIDDALAKLRGLELVESAPLLRSRPLPEALARLDRRWDDLFRHQSDGGTVPVTGQ
jgi:hypothetical protein